MVSVPIRVMKCHSLFDIQDVSQLFAAFNPQATEFRGWWRLQGRSSTSTVNRSFDTRSAPSPILLRGADFKLVETTCQITVWRALETRCAKAKTRDRQGGVVFSERAVGHRHVSA